MPAGDSALRRSQELDGEADALFELSERVRVKARRYAVASASERALAGRLRSLSHLGWVVLEDRRWPGSKRANVDFLLVGPGGVVVLDAKSWADLEVRDGVVYRDQSPEEEEVAKLVALVDSLASGLSEVGVTTASVHAAMVFDGRHLVAEVGPITVLGDADVATWLSRLRHRLAAPAIARVLAAVEARCPPMAS